MRVVGYIEHPVLKISIFQMHNKFAVKFETALLEQTYKVRTGEAINTIEDVRRLVDAKFIEAVVIELQRMQAIQKTALERFLPKSEDDEFEDII